MNDEFLASFRRPPREKFAAALSERIHQPMKTKTGFFDRILRPTAYGLGVLTALLAAAMIISPGARALAVVLAQQIGGLVFHTAPEMDKIDLPPGVIGSYDLYIRGNDPAAFGIEVGPQAAGTVDEGRARLGYSFGLPAWVPEGFTFNPEVKFPPADYPVANPSAWLAYENVDKGVINFSVMYPASKDVEYVIGEGSVEQVQVNGQPAAVQRGLWNYETKQWAETGLIILRWEKDGAIYQLMADSGSVLLEELVRMAESVP